MVKKLRGLFTWVGAILTRPKTPPWTIVEFERPVPIIDHADDAAILSLAHHPGMIALLRRFRLQRGVLESQLITQRFKDINDVVHLQSGIAWARVFESEIRNATQNLEVKKQRPATFDEAEQFNKIRNAIESVRPTDPS